MVPHSTRERDARQLVLWYSGNTDRHPHGSSGSSYLLPAHLTQNCWDTSPMGHQFSEWGNAAGFYD